ncbi:hypothetical protein CHUAL_007703 [Chamberlinius hualienensis]
MDESKSKSSAKLKKKTTKSAPSKTNGKKSASDGNGKARRSVNSAAAMVASRAAESGSGSDRNGHGNRLFTNNNQTPSGLISPAEPNLAFSPCGGDVQTMVCDLSPVPSDVESIYNDHVTNNKGNLLSFNSKRHSRLGFDKDKRRVLQSLTASRQPANETNQFERSDSNHVSVRIVPDSAKARSKVVVGKHSSKTVMAKPSSTKSSMPSTKNRQQQRNQKETTPSEATMNTTVLNKVEVTSETPTDIPDENVSGTNEPDDVLSDQLESTLDLHDDISICDSISQMKEESSAEIGVRLNTTEDDECCKAYEVLKSHGFNVSLETLRRALLTPTECRKLRDLETKTEKSN